MKADPKTAADVKSAIAALADHYEKRNLAGLAACFAPDDDVTLVGTGADEMRVGRAQIEAQASRDWQQTDAAAMRFDDMAVSAAGDVAWVMANGVFEVKAGSQDLRLPVRVTFVLERRNGRWLIVQSHFSTPTAGQGDGQSMPG